MRRMWIFLLWILFILALLGRLERKAMADVCDPPDDIILIRSVEINGLPVGEGEILKLPEGTIDGLVEVDGYLAMPPYQLDCTWDMARLVFYRIYERGTTIMDPILPLTIEGGEGTSTGREFRSPSTLHPIWAGGWSLEVQALFGPNDRFRWKRRNFQVDINPPTLSINSPADGTVVKAGTEGFQIDVTSSDDVGTKDFTVKVDGIVRDTFNAREDKPTLRQWLRAMVFGSGRRVITVVARDKVDRTDERTFTVHSDGDPPTISNLRPEPNAPGNSYRTTASRVGISADILDRGMAGVKEVRLLDISQTRILDRRTLPYEGNRYIFEMARPSGSGTRISQHYIQAFDKVSNVSLSNVITIVWEEPPLGIKKEPIVPKRPALPKEKLPGR